MSVKAFKVKSCAKQVAIYIYIFSLTISCLNSSAQEEVGGRRRICVDDAVRRTGVILEFHTALTQASHPQMHRSSWMCLNHRMSTASTLSDKQPPSSPVWIWKKAWLLQQNEVLLLYSQILSRTSQTFYFFYCISTQTYHILRNNDGRLVT